MRYKRDNLFIEHGDMTKENFCIYYFCIPIPINSTPITGGMNSVF